MRKEVIPIILALLLASLLGTGLVAARWIYTGRPAYLFLLWNLFLAWLPLLMALATEALRRLPPLALGPALLWLLFLPNAPYLLTDLMHLGRWGNAPLWVDLLLLLIFGLTGLLLGFVSLELMHGLVEDVLGRLAGWLFVVVALSLSSVGVYIGRFLRWNSWDALLQPAAVGGDLLILLQQPWLHRQAYVFSLGLAAVLVCAYIALRLKPHAPI
jgi:uncharacterized membrane protein